MSVKLLSSANRSAAVKLLPLGVKWFEFHQSSTLYHKKVMIVDEITTAIGSYNISYCAEPEDENLVIMHSPKIAEKTQKILEDDIAKCTELLLTRYSGVSGFGRQALNYGTTRIILLATAHISQ